MGPLRLPPFPIFKRLKELAGSHLVPVVTGGLCVIWMTISWGVYVFERHSADANITSFGDALWWGIVTFLTVGYGDRFPVTPGGRVLASLLMLAGVFAIAILTSKISSFFLERLLREGRGHVNTSKLKNHFVVCGWKEEMDQILTHILDFNSDIEAGDLVLVANMSPAMMENLLESPRLKKLQMIAGNYYEVATLQRAAPERARKVLILADRCPGPNGVVPSMTEIDARTIMTAMTLSSIARGTLVAAEILDPKMEQYLKMAQVSEIIYSREYSRLLLGNAAGGTGVTNVIFDLLDPRTPARIVTQAIADEWLGRSYRDFKAGFEMARPEVNVLGILENTGNSHRIKELALRQAQKTSDVGRLVQNLRSVKELKCNHPVFNPPEGYTVPEGSMAIVIENRATQAAATDRDEVKNAGSKFASSQKLSA